MKLGILCASDTELAPFISTIKNIKIHNKSMLAFYEGMIEQTPVVAVFSGVGKVNSAIAAQILIDIFHVDGIINAGTAGGIQKEIQLFDTIIASQTTYHDIDHDILTDFHPWLEDDYFYGDENWLASATAFAKKYFQSIKIGLIVTGDRFIDNTKRTYIEQNYSPLAVDMESASVAHVCHVNQISFLSIRTITDTFQQNGIPAFEENCEQASSICADFVVNFIRYLTQTH